MLRGVVGERDWHFNQRADALATRGLSLHGEATELAAFWAWIDQQAAAAVAFATKVAKMGVAILHASQKIAADPLHKARIAATRHVMASVAPQVRQGFQDLVDQNDQGKA